MNGIKSGHSIKSVSDIDHCKESSFEWGKMTCRCWGIRLQNAFRHTCGPVQAKGVQLNHNFPMAPKNIDNDNGSSNRHIKYQK
jgi:hypothetical protein